MRQSPTELQGEIHKPTITAGDFNTLQGKDRSSRQKISKDTDELINQLNITDLYGPLWWLILGVNLTGLRECPTSW